ncbi:hypothetical protein KKC32_02915 [Patescibacteria group bacterium]|nr:hypothetical protein [Patescibacteria group bacterium]
MAEIKSEAIAPATKEQKIASLEAEMAELAKEAAEAKSASAKVKIKIRQMRAEKKLKEIRTQITAM